MSNLKMFNLIMSYFPHRSSDPNLIFGGDYYGTPYALGYIVIDLIGRGDRKDIDSVVSVVNDLWSDKTNFQSNSSCSTNDIDAFVYDALEHLYPQGSLKPLFRFGGRALEKANFWLKKDERFNGVLFGQEMFK